MSNFKEIYPQRNFREDLYRMDSLGEDDYEVLAYNGAPDEAPLASEYCYILTKNTKTTRNTSISITDGIDSPIEKIKIYGKAQYNLPDDYIKLYYIESNGSQYIDTGIAAQGDIETYSTFAFTRTPNASYSLAGARSSFDNRCYIFNTDNSGKWGFGYKNQLLTINDNKPQIDKIYTGYCKLANGNQQIQVDNINYLKSISGELDINVNIAIFGYNYNGNISKSSVRLYAFSLYINGELKRDFIPMKRNIDNVVGLYDLVSNTFFVNQGAGAFIAGPEISGGTIDKPIPLEVVGVYNNDNNLWETVITCKNIKTKLMHEQPLCSLGDNYIDYYDDGVIYYNTVYTKLLNTSNWQIENTFTNNNILVVSLFVPSAIKQTDYIYCTHFSPSNDMSVPNHIKIDNQRIYLSMDKQQISGVNEFLSWLGQNNVIIIYNRKSPKQVLVEPKIVLKTYDGTTNITNDQNAEMEIEYRVAPNARVWKKQENGTFIELTS